MFESGIEPNFSPLFQKEEPIDIKATRDGLNKLLIKIYPSLKSTDYSKPFYKNNRVKNPRLRYAERAHRSTGT